MLWRQVESQEVQPGSAGPAGPEREPGCHAGSGQHDHRGPETLPGTGTGLVKRTVSIVMFMNDRVLSVASRVLAPSVFTGCRGPGGLPVRAWRRPGGAGGEDEKAAVEHSAPPEGGQGEEPRLGGAPGPGARGADLQEGKTESLK